MRTARARATRPATPTGTRPAPRTASSKARTRLTARTIPTSPGCRPAPGSASGPTGVREGRAAALSALVADQDPRIGGADAGLAQPFDRGPHLGGLGVEGDLQQRPA